MKFPGDFGTFKLCFFFVFFCLELGFNFLLINIDHI